jgi:hypothetical protein
MAGTMDGTDVTPQRVPAVHRNITAAERRTNSQMRFATETSLVFAALSYAQSKKQLCASLNGYYSGAVCPSRPAADSGVRKLPIGRGAERGSQMFRAASLPIRATG